MKNLQSGCRLNKHVIVDGKLQAPCPLCYIPIRVIDIYLGVAMNIRELLALARQKSNVKSNRQLSIKLQIAESNLGNYEKGWYIPTDDILCKICKLADNDPKPWLLWARIQREQGEARQHWEKITAAYVKSTTSQVA